jgi:transcriptional regulator with XRE-family HTH domain
MKSVEEFNVELAFAIKDRRQRARMTQAQVAAKLCVHENVVQRMETGKHKISVFDLCRLSLAIGIHPAEFVGGVATEAYLSAVDGRRAFRRAFIDARKSSDIELEHKAREEQCP